MCICHWKRTTLFFCVLSIVLAHLVAFLPPLTLYYDVLFFLFARVPPLLGHSHVRRSDGSVAYERRESLQKNPSMPGLAASHSGSMLLAGVDNDEMKEEMKETITKAVDDVEQVRRAARTTSGLPPFLAN